MFIKRCIDFFGSLFGIILILPLLIVISFSVKFTSKGPIFFRQERLGKKGKVFKIVKFRTMVVNAEKIGDGLKINSENDDRITKVGKFLRATSLDELPQLWNVLVGDMSMVGPRPPATYFPYDGYDNYPDWAKKRFEMRPGMTGLTQVTVRNSVPWDERIAIDIEYMEKFNILLDIKILFKTLKKVFVRENIYRPVEKETANESKSEINV